MRDAVRGVAVLPARGATERAGSARPALVCRAGCGAAGAAGALPGSVVRRSVVPELPHVGNAAPPAPPVPRGVAAAATIDVFVKYNGGTATVRLPVTASDAAVKDAIAVGSGVAPGVSFGLVDVDGVITTASIGTLGAGSTYRIMKVPDPIPRCDEGKDARNQQPAVKKKRFRVGDNGILAEDGTVLSDKKARLPRVVITSLGTGRYKQLAVDAMESGVKFFGGDCEPSFHVLADNVSDVAPHLNGAEAPYREWPHSGLMKFKDIMNALEEHIKHADYFFFMDADVRFMEHVELADIGADLMGVEHPMYPRYQYGWCKPGDPNTRGFCQFPYDRNPKSKAFIPDGHGRYVDRPRLPCLTLSPP